MNFDTVFLLSWGTVNLLLLKYEQQFGTFFCTEFRRHPYVLWLLRSLAGLNLMGVGFSLAMEWRWL
jgi:hypothetical protein